MGFSTMIGLLQRKNKGSIILVNAGSFYIARGKRYISNSANNINDNNYFVVKLFFMSLLKTLSYINHNA